MKHRWIGGLLVVLALGSPELSLGHECAEGAGGDTWWRGRWSEEFWDGPCEVKLESKRGEFKREIKCKDGVGATWRGEWKKEFWDGPCKVQIDARRDAYTEEVKCVER